MTAIESESFKGCSSLNSIIIPDDVTVIAYKAFSDCTSLSSVSIPENVKEIDVGAFKDCYDLKEVYYSGTEEQWKIIGIASGNLYLKLAYYDFINSSTEPTFGACGDNLEWNLYSSGLLTIDGEGEMTDWPSSYAPWYNLRDNIKSVMIPADVTKIGTYAFKDCSNLSYIMLPYNVQKIRNQDFEGCTKLSAILFGGGDNNKYYSNISGALYSKDKKTLELCPIGYSETFTIADGVTNISSDAFWGCNGLPSVIIPESVTNIEKNAFPDCTSLRDVYYAGTEEQWKSISIASGNTALKAATMHYNSVGSVAQPSITENQCGDNLYFTLDDDGVLTVSGIGDMWDYYDDDEASVQLYPKNEYKHSPFDEIHSSIKKIIVSEQVTSIGRKAFRNCENLTEVEFPESLTSIGTEAFNGCPKLDHVLLPNNISYIGLYSLGYTGKDLDRIEGEDGTTVSRIQLYLHSDTKTNRSFQLLGVRCHYLNGIIETALTCDKRYKYNYSKEDQVMDLKLTIENKLPEDNYYDLLSGEGVRVMFELPVGVKLKSANDKKVNDDDLYFSLLDTVTMDYKLHIPETVKNGEHIEIGVKVIADDIKNRNEATQKYVDVIKTPKNEVTHRIIIQKEPDRRGVDQKVLNVYDSMNTYYQAQNAYANALREASQERVKAAKALDVTEGYLKLMEEEDQKISDKDRVITFDPKATPEAREDTYEVLYNYWKKGIKAANQDSAIQFDIDNTEKLPIIETKMVQKIYDSVYSTCKTAGKSKGKNGYVVNIKVNGILGVKAGTITITKDNEYYLASYTDDQETVAKVMNLYLSDLCNEVKKQYKEACFALQDYFSEVTGIRDIYTQIGSEKLNDMQEWLSSNGFGKLFEVLPKVQNAYKNCSDLYEVVWKDNFQELETFLASDKKAQSKQMYEYIKNAKIEEDSVTNERVKSAMDTLEKARKNAEDALFDYAYDGKTFNIVLRDALETLFSCPVDVDVINETTHKVVGYVHDGVAYSDGSIEVSCDQDCKRVILPKNEKFSFVLTGTDEGTMQILYKDIKDGEETSYTAFYDVPLTKGITYQQKLNTGDIPDDASAFPVLTGDGSTIYASAVYTAQDDDRLISIVADTENGGICSGSGAYTKGDSVFLDALPAENYVFTGWYEDNVLISIQPSYRFPAMQDRTLTARFEKNLPELTECKWGVSEEYVDDVMIHTYKDDSGLLIECSVYNETTSPSAVQQYAGDEKKMKMTSDDGIHYLMESVPTKGLTSITLYDGDKQIAVLNYTNGEDGPSTSLPGDVDGDGEVTLRDVVRLHRSIVGWNVQIVSENSDVDGDGELSLRDVVRLHRYVVGWNVQLL